MERQILSGGSRGRAACPAVAVSRRIVSNFALPNHDEALLIEGSSNV
jgi:hypothetical protein